MTKMTAGIRELKARLSNYLQQVKAGATLIITEWGKPDGHIVPPGHRRRGHGDQQRACRGQLAAFA